MATVKLDVIGLRCPQPIQMIITHMHETEPGDLLEVSADCPSFEQDVTNWAQRSGHTLLAINRIGDVMVAQVQV
jgi:tRNA 2-thiouridine synthesizing protein A